MKYAVHSNRVQSEKYHTKKFICQVGANSCDKPSKSSNQSCRLRFNYFWLCTCLHKEVIPFSKARRICNHNGMCVCVCLWNTVRQEWWILCIFDEKNCHIRRKHPIVLVTSRLFYRSPKFKNWKLCSHKVGSMETFHIWHMAYGCIIEGSRTFLFL